MPLNFVNLNTLKKLLLFTFSTFLPFSREVFFAYLFLWVGVGNYNKLIFMQSIFQC